MNVEKGKSLHQTAVERFRTAWEDDSENRGEAKDDLRFVNGKQWPEAYENERKAEGQPCLVINRSQRFVDQVVGDQRQNRPRIKIHPVDNNSDIETAKIIEGIIRNIETVSNADVAYDSSIENTTACGRAFIMIVNRYVDDESFEQELLIRAIRDPLSVTWDPNAAEHDLSDAKYIFISDYITREAFKEQYPNAAEAPVEGDGDWATADKIRIAQYWYVMSGAEILEGPYTWTRVLPNGRRCGRYIPIVPVWGKELYVDGKRRMRGLIRFTKDAQRLYNYAKTVEAELLILAPKVPWIGTEEMFKGHTDEWNMAHSRKKAFLTYNPDPQAKQAKPERPEPIHQHSGLVSTMANADDDMKATTGIYDTGLGAPSNETSGKAIMLRQKESDTATFAFIDNLSRAMTHIGKILLDLIPAYYSEEKMVRILGVDNKPQNVPVNQPVAVNPVTKEIIGPDAGSAELMDAIKIVQNDLTVGKYDVVVTTGPSFNTQRIETAEMLMKFVQSAPQTLELIGDQIFENLDWPNADKIAEGFRMLLPEQLRAQQGADVNEQ